MSVIYEALKKAEDERAELGSSVANWCEEFIFVSKKPKVGINVRRYIISALAMGVVGLGVVFAWPRVQPYVATLYASMSNSRVQQMPQDLVALKREAQAAYADARFADAVRLWEMVLTHESGDTLLYTHLALSCRKVGSLDKAETYNQKALALDPSNAEVLNNLGVVYIDQNRIDEAIEMLKRAAERPDYADPYFHLGRLYEKKGSYAEASAAYATFVERYPNPGDSIVNTIRTRIEALRNLPQ